MTNSDTRRREYPSWSRPAAVWTAAAAGGLSLVVCAVMAVQAVRMTMDDPLDSIEFRSLQEQLRLRPADKALKQRLRAMDLELREEYFGRQRLLVSGGYILAVCLGIFVLAAKLAGDIRKKPPAPSGAPQAGGQWRMARLGRWSVAALAAAVGSAALIAAIVAPPRPLEHRPPPAADRPPPPQGHADNWAGFRGHDGSGIVRGAEVPATWDAPAARNIAWKAPVDLPGHNSPVVWGDRVLLTGADDRKREIYCFDAGTGRALWTRGVRNVPGSPSAAPQVMEDTGYAAPTGVTDGRRFYAIFANGDIACVDFDGRLIWARNLGLPDNVYGYASSLRMHRGRLLVLYDQGDAEAGRSYLYALDALTGRTVYRARRPVANSWTTPILISAAGRDQFITVAEPWVVSHDPDTGRILWRFGGIGADTAPSPVFAGGLVLAVSSNDALYAIRPDGAGDVTVTHLTWRSDRNVPDICSPVANDELVFLLTTFGTLSCLELQSGKMLWEHQFEAEFKSSPSLIGRRLLLTTTEGVSYFVAAERRFRLLGEARLGEAVTCSPAFAHGRIYIRGKGHLFCIAEGPK